MLLINQRRLIFFRRRLTRRFLPLPPLRRTDPSKTRLAAVLSLLRGTNLTNCDGAMRCSPEYPATRNASRPFTNRIHFVDLTLRRRLPIRFLVETLLVVAPPFWRRRCRGINSDSIGKRVARSSLVEKFNKGLLVVKVMSW